MRKITLTSLRYGVAVAVFNLASTAVYAQGLLDQLEKVGTGVGRTTSAVMGPVAFALAIFLLVIGCWSLYLGSDKQNAGRGYYGKAGMAFIAGFIAAGLGTWATLGSTTMTGAAPTASTSSFTFR